MLDALESHWRAAGLDLRPGVSAAELDTFESFNRVRLPAAMRAFYARIDGMPDCECDGLIFGFSEFSKLYNVLVLACSRGVAPILPASTS